MSQTVQAILELEKQLGQRIVGQPQVVRQLILALLCNGHVLLEGYPGTAKTRAMKSLALLLNASMGRVQFTPDLLPSDITGTEVYVDDGSRHQLVFQQGPVFNQLLLADEINRAPAKVQSALLEAMEERQITVAGQSYSLPEPFLVMATQNALEQEGTYPLPEAQLDRFLFKVMISYPQRDSERVMMDLVRQEEEQQQWAPDSVTELSVLDDARQQISAMQVSDTVADYIVDLVMATRQPDSFQQLGTLLAAGVSPRATIALNRAARAHAWLEGRSHVDPDDVKAIAPAVLRHRLLLDYDAMARGVDSEEVIALLLQQVAVA